MGKNISSKIHVPQQEHVFTTDNTEVITLYSISKISRQDFDTICRNKISPFCLRTRYFGQLQCKMRRSKSTSCYSIHTFRSKELMFSKYFFIQSGIKPITDIVSVFVCLFVLPFSCDLENGTPSLTPVFFFHTLRESQIQYGCIKLWRSYTEVQISPTYEELAKMPAFNVFTRTRNVSISIYDLAKIYSKALEAFWQAGLPQSVTVTHDFCAHPKQVGWAGEGG